MGSMNIRTKARLKRKKRIRKKISGTIERPRLSVFRSSKHIYAQLIDDINGNTVASASTLDKKINDFKVENKVQMAVHVGQILAKRSLEKGFKKVVFDRNGFQYHGRVKALSDGAREAGLDF